MASDKFEAGTPAIINIIAFARALQLIRHFGKDAFMTAVAEKPTAREILYQYSHVRPCMEYCLQDMASARKSTAGDHP
jgi:selenocysteine lyase/cysteine desulfurase